MKKIVFLAGALFTLSGVAAQEQKATLNDLPADAINFVRQHFLVANITSVWKDIDYNDEDYSVIFKDGVEVEFNGEGDWKELKARYGKLPDQVIPAKILAHVQTTYPSKNIKELSRSLSKKKYEVELNDELEIKFDEQFNVIGLK